MKPTSKFGRFPAKGPRRSQSAALAAADAPEGTDDAIDDEPLAEPPLEDTESAEAEAETADPAEVTATEDATDGAIETEESEVTETEDAIDTTDDLGDAEAEGDLGEAAVEHSTGDTTNEQEG